MTTGEPAQRMVRNAYLRGREALIGLLHRSDEEGQGMVEYALILMLVAIVIIVVLSTVGKQVKNMVSNVSSGLGT